MHHIHIRPYQESDWSMVWPILQAIFAAGDTYPFPPDSIEKDIYSAWVSVPTATFVACDDSGRITAAYYIKPNQPGLGAHVCNCGYVVAPDVQGRGIASQMCEHSQVQAIEMGFRAMQFNLVVATNERAIRLWQRHGFSIIGRLPGAFLHQNLGYVDALILFKLLVDG